VKTLIIVVVAPAGARLVAPTKISLEREKCTMLFVACIAE
jgi:hypothetical protein